MKINNASDRDLSWFCYNSNDGLKLIALASGDLPYGSPEKDYNPPKNATGKYFVRFTNPGGGTEHAGGTLKKNQRITIKGEKGVFQIEVT